ncbi:MAG: spore maturation protein [Clostridia bacterium]|nr:spore maturation protein [Clostridia bacterium]
MNGDMLIPAMLVVLLGAAEWKRLPVYDLFAAGAKKGMSTAVQVVPNLAAMLCAISLMQTSGLMDAISSALSPVFEWTGMPAEVGPLVLMRPISGSGALAMLSQLLEHYGADSRIGLIACTVMGSSETIFYTVCIYTGVVEKWKSGYAIGCSLAGAMAGVWLAGMLF